MTMCAGHPGRRYNEVTVELTGPAADPSNLGLVGHYIVTFLQPCPEEQVACAALNIFHEQVLLPEGYQFDLVVWDFDGHALGESDDWEPELETGGGSIVKRVD